VRLASRAARSWGVVPARDVQLLIRAQAHLLAEEAHARTAHERAPCRGRRNPPAILAVGHGFPRVGPTSSRQFYATSRGLKPAASAARERAHGHGPRAAKPPPALDIFAATCRAYNICMPSIFLARGAFKRASRRRSQAADGGSCFQAEPLASRRDILGGHGAEVVPPGVEDVVDDCGDLFIRELLAPGHHGRARSTVEHHIHHHLEVGQVLVAR